MAVMWRQFKGTESVTWSGECGRDEVSVAGTVRMWLVLGGVVGVWLRCILCGCTVCDGREDIYGMLGVWLGYG